MPQLFIGMETSGALRTRFAALGYSVLSCDNLPAEDGCEYDPISMTGHYVGDVFETVEKLWRGREWPQLGIFHPDCTFLTNSAAWAFNDADYVRYPGVGYHQRPKVGTLVGAERREARERALDDVRRIIALNIDRIVIENPIGAINTAIRKPTQIIQPYEFGDDASKGTALWFFDREGWEKRDMCLPIDPVKRVSGRLVNGREYWSNQTDTGQNRLSPGDDRWKDRSRTFPGIADAMVAAWARYIS